MADEAPAPKKSGPKIKLLVILVLVSFLGGAGAGVLAWTNMGLNAASEVDDAKNHTPEVAESHHVQIDVGRITLVLQTGETTDTRHLLVNPVVVLDLGSEDSGSHDAPTSNSDTVAVLRDVFIEYLSQLSVRDVTGSAGMSLVRGELKRRATASLSDQTVSEVLFQDFVVQ
ncbi:MAG: hypothetical protein CMH12_22950 [Maritimibacter sp.]|nr:hypothetical protein [Maritimibacter sp.]